MKKILSIFLMLAVVLSVLPAAFAEDTDQTEDTTDTEDQTVIAPAPETEDETAETEIMHTVPGAEVRLLQLEKAITRNILRGQEVIKEVDNSTELQAIIAEMEALKTEVQNADPNAEDAVQVFVDLKSDAIELCKRFRDTARPLVKAEKMEALKDKLKKVDDEKLKELREKVKAKIRAFNSERFVALANILGIEGDQTLEKIKSGELDAKQVKEQIKEKLKAMTNEERKDAYQQLKEMKVKNRVAAKAKLNEIRQNSIERRQERLQARLGKLEAAGKKIENLEEYTKKRLENLEAKDQRLGAKGGRK